MFIRKKKNRSGSVSIVVVDKSGHKFREKQTIGISSDPAEIERLCLEGQRWIHNYNGQQDLFTQEAKAGIAARERVSSISKCNSGKKKNRILGHAPRCDEGKRFLLCS
jgi:hypothetical protein